MKTILTYLGLQYGVCGVGIAGVLLIVKATRSTKVFRRLSDIPAHYISQNVTLQGVVENVTPKCCLLVKHTPILKLPSLLSPFSKSSQEYLLPVQLAGLESNPAARQWLIQKVKDQHIWFQLLAVSRDTSRLECLVMTKKKWMFRAVINEDLVRIGICRVRGPHHPRPSTYNDLLSRLVVMETKADRNRKCPPQSGTLRRSATIVKNFVTGIVTSLRRFSDFLSRFRKKS